MAEQGGKSGTSEKIDDYNSGKTPELRYVATFCAIVPIDDPEYVMLVVCDEPTSGYIYGSAIAAPVVSAVFKEGLEQSFLRIVMMRYLNL